MSSVLVVNPENNLFNIITESQYNDITANHNTDFVTFTMDVVDDDEVFRGNDVEFMQRQIIIQQLRDELRDLFPESEPEDFYPDRVGVLMHQTALLDYSYRYPDRIPDLHNFRIALLQNRDGVSNSINLNNYDTFNNLPFVPVSPRTILEVPEVPEVRPMNEIFNELIFAPPQQNEF